METVDLRRKYKNKHGESILGKNFKETQAKSYNNRGVTKANKGDYDGTIADCNKAIELNPEYTKAYYNRGNVKAMLKQFEEAIQDYTRVINLDPENAAAYNNRGNVKAILGRVEEAKEDYLKGDEIVTKKREKRKKMNEKVRIMFFWSVEIRDYDGVQKMLAKRVHGKINVNAGDEEGMTPLHLAALIGDKKMVELLLKKGADPTIIDTSNETACLWAMQQGHDEIAEIIEKAMKKRSNNDQIKKYP